MTGQLHLSAAPREATAAGVDADRLRQTMGSFATGVAVVTSLDADGEPVGATANAICSLSLEPPLMLACLARTSNTLRAIRAHGAFAISILAAGHSDVSNGFARSGIAPATWELVGRHHGTTGSPRLAGALAWLDCSLERLLPGGDHEIAIGRVLELEPSPTSSRAHLELPFTTSINAASLIGAGWSLSDRALTMRVAAHADSGPGDLRVPGHVHPVRIADEHFLSSGGAVAGSLELARHAQRRAAVALCAVVDRAGAPVEVPELLAQRRFSALPLVDSSELQALLRAGIVRDAAIECALPTRGGSFRVLAHGFSTDGELLLALVHGDPSASARTLVHAHAGCLLGDVFASLRCTCRAELDRAVAEITRIGAGVILYRKAPGAPPPMCAGAGPIDASVAAGLLARVGVSRVRIDGGHAALAPTLRALGLDVENRQPLVRAA